VSFFEPNEQTQASVRVGSGTVALASAHTSCLRRIVKERTPETEADR